MSDVLKIRRNNGTYIFPDQGMDIFVDVVGRLMEHRGPVVLVPVEAKGLDKTGLMFEVLEVDTNE